MPLPPPSAQYGEWNVNDLSTNAVVTGGTTITSNNSSTAGARGALSRMGSAKVCLSFTNVTLSNSNDCVGIGGASVSLTSFSSAGDEAVLTFGGTQYANGTSVGSNSMPIPAGANVDFAFNYELALWWVRINGGSWNGSGTADPATAVGGNVMRAWDDGSARFPYICLTGTSTHATLVTAPTWTLPNGYSIWNLDDTTTSYSNWGGDGNRSALITTSYSGITGGCFPATDLSALLDGSLATGTCTNSLAWGNTNTAALLKFDFRAGNKMVIDAFTWRQSDSSSHGTWSFAGSNDDITYTNLTTGITLGGSTDTEYTFSNSTGYRYYKLFQTGGTTSNTPWIEEIDFRIKPDATMNTTYDHPFARGGRSLTITATDSGITGGCGTPYAAGLIDGEYIDGCSTAAAWGNTNTASVLLFDFGSGNQPIIDEFLWHQDVNATHGTWSFAGSNDNVTYTNLSTGITLGVSNGYGQAAFAFSNTTGYRYYKLFQTGGTTSATPWNREIEFKIGINSGAIWASTEAPDTMSAIGYPGFPGEFGQFASTEATDTIVAIGLTSDLGLWSSTEAKDIFGASGRVVIQGPWASTEAADHMAAAGLGFGQNGIWASTEAPDIFAASGSTPITGVLASTEITDRFVALGAGVTRARRRRQLIVA